MSEPNSSPEQNSTATEQTTPEKPRRWPYLLIGFLMAAATFGILALVMNIFERKQEGQQYFTKVVELDENTIDPKVWARNFPRQYDTHIRTVDNQYTQYGGSEAFAPSRLDEKPELKRFFAGYAFSVDFREARGHAYMLSDQMVTKRTTEFNQPGACIHCHASVLPVYREAGEGDVQAGFEKVCSMPLKDVHEKVEFAISCIDCHDPETTALRVTRPGFINGMEALAKSDDPVPHMPSVERWRTGKRKADYDVNALASRQEMRSFVCGQCHVEYYFKGDQKLVTYPWHNGLKVEQIEAYYDEQDFTDWVHKETKAPMLKAQHPEFEMWSQGIHARAGVSCADCHMPYKREGAIKITDHHVKSPMLNISRACATCHRTSEAELTARVEIIQNRTITLQKRADRAVLDLMDAILQADRQGVAKADLQEARNLHRRAQWRIDFCDAENSQGFHADQEYARILGEAIDYARQGQLKAVQATLAK